MNVLILGTTGFLGSHLQRTLNCAQNSVLSIPHSPTRQWLVSFFAAQKVDWVINCMGAYQKEGYERVMEGNLYVPMLVILTAAESGVKNFINMNTSLPEYFNFYSFCKSELGNFGKFCNKQYDVNFYNLLLEMFYSADEPEDRFLSSIVRKLRKDECIELTEGTQYRDLVHVEDICTTVEFLMNQNLLGYYDIPLGTGEKHTIRETVEFLKKNMKSKSELCFGAVPMRKNEPDCIADMSFLRSLGYQSIYSWEDGLKTLL